MVRIERPLKRRRLRQKTVPNQIWFDESLPACALPVGFFNLEEAVWNKLSPNYKRTLFRLRSLEEAAQKQQAATPKAKVQPKQRFVKQKPAAAVTRKPAAAKTTRRPSELCPGTALRPCTFSTTSLGARALIHPSRGQTHCSFCDGGELDKILRTKKGAQLTKTLTQLRAMDADIYEAALKNLSELKGEGFTEDFKRRVERVERRQGMRAAAPAPAIPDQWINLLQHRESVKGALSAKKSAEYKDQVRRDRATVRRKVFLPSRKRKKITEATEAEECGQLPLPDDDIAINDTGLPATSRSKRARQVELWCKFGSWSMCERCRSVRPRPLKAMDVKRLAPPTVKKCQLCRRGDYVPQLDDVPEVLRNLSEKAIRTLRPLDVDSGKYERAPHGYRVHTAMMTFRWSAKGVRKKIAKLKNRATRRKTLAAYNFLMASEDSAYKHFVEEQKSFLSRHGDAEEKVRRRPLRFIEEPGIECALWPHLYWHRNLCETVVRSTDDRRVARQNGGAKAGDDEEDSSDAGDSSDKEGGEEADKGDIQLKDGRHSIRQNFMKKVFSPVVGYSEDYELLHFVYDLCMWSCLGGCKEATRGIPLRLALKGASFTPAFWRVRHMGLIDLQRQCGFPALFRTRAPYEKSFPYHAWVLDEMAKLGKPRQQLAGPETIHMAHVLKEMDRGLFRGANQRKTGQSSRHWSDYILAPEEADVQTSAVNGFTRLEFQDGKRKRGTQRYHGRGTVHSHSLDYLDNQQAVKLEAKVSATVPGEEEPLLRGLVLDSQLDWKESGWPLREEPSRWDAASNRVLLQHTAADHERHVRAHFPETMEITKCHEDLLQGDGRGAMLRYVATYTPKFSDSFAKEWLNDDASSYSVARRVLFDYHPLEPEMWLSLAAKLVPPCGYGGTLYPIVAPWPGMEKKPDFVELYETSGWRGESMTLLEFLRKSGKSGGIIRWLKEKHRQQPDSSSQTVEEFARGYVCKGEKLVAAETVSRQSDKFFGQWLALNIPFRHLEDLVVPDIAEKVPERYLNFACALHHARHHWEDEAAIRAEMELEAFGNAHIETVMDMIRAQRHVVEQYLSGAISKGDEAANSRRRRQGEDEGDSSGSEEDDNRLDQRHDFTNAQKMLERSIDVRVQQAVDAKQAEDEAEYEVIAARAEEQNSIVAGLGPPGTARRPSSTAASANGNGKGLAYCLLCPRGSWHLA